MINQETVDALWMAEAEATAAYEVAETAFVRHRTPENERAMWEAHERLVAVQKELLAVVPDAYANC